MRLIDADALMDAIAKQKTSAVSAEYFKGVTECVEKITNAPTVAIKALEDRPSVDNKLFICDRKMCERCSPDCYITSDMNHRARTDTVVFINGDRVVVKSEEIKYPHWINLGHLGRSGDHPYSVWYKCSECGFEQYWWMTEKCPHCGAIMEGIE